MGGVTVQSVVRAECDTCEGISTAVYVQYIWEDATDVEIDNAMTKEFFKIGWDVTPDHCWCLQCKTLPR